MYFTKSLTALLATSTTVFSAALVQASPIDNIVEATGQEVGLSPGFSSNQTLTAELNKDPSTCKCSYRFLFVNYDIWLPEYLYDEANQWGRHILKKLEKDCGLVCTLHFS